MHNTQFHKHSWVVGLSKREFRESFFQVIGGIRYSVYPEAGLAVVGLTVPGAAEVGLTVVTGAAEVGLTVVPGAEVGLTVITEAAKVGWPP